MELFYSESVCNGICELNAEESGHCVRVLRHRAGDAITVIDGLGTLYNCTLLDDNPKAATARVESRTEDFGSHPYHLTMAVCPTKNTDRFEWFAEKATEVGVDVIAPVIGDHSERKVFKTDRIKRLVLSAIKQSLKARLPEVPEAVSVREFIENADAGALKLICYCADDVKKRISIKDALSEAGRPEKICILIGPEGDFSQEEVSLALSRGWQAVHLGDSRLRTETAALVATTAVYLTL